MIIVCWIIYLHCFRNTFNISWWSSHYAVSHGCLWPSRISWCKRGRSNITWYELLVVQQLYFVSVLVIKVSVLVHLFIIFNWQLFNKNLRTITFYLVVPPVPVEVAIGKVNNDMLLSSMNCCNQCRKSNSCIFWS